MDLKFNPSLQSLIHMMLHPTYDLQIPDSSPDAFNAFSQAYPKAIYLGNIESKFHRSMSCEVGQERSPITLKMSAARLYYLWREQRTNKVMEFGAGDHYRWICTTAMSEESKRGRIVKKSHLQVK